MEVELVKTTTYEDVPEGAIFQWDNNTYFKLLHNSKDPYTTPCGLSFRVIRLSDTRPMDFSDEIEVRIAHGKFIESPV